MNNPTGLAIMFDIEKRMPDCEELRRKDALMYKSHQHLENDRDLFEVYVPQVQEGTPRFCQRNAAPFSVSDPL